jgi:hypothetical protein
VVIFACHLTRIIQSGGYSEFRQYVGLQQEPHTHNHHHDYDLFHRLFPLFMHLSGRCPLFFEDQAVQIDKQKCHDKPKVAQVQKDNELMGKIVHRKVFNNKYNSL